MERRRGLRSHGGHCGNSATGALAPIESVLASESTSRPHLIQRDDSGTRISRTGCDLCYTRSSGLDPCFVHTSCTSISTQAVFFSAATQPWHPPFHPPPSGPFSTKSPPSSLPGTRPSPSPKQSASPSTSFQAPKPPHTRSPPTFSKAAGGIISASLLSVPGASKFYRGGLTLYTLESRIQFAGWTEENKKNYNGPNAEVVSGLAKNVRGKLGSTYCLCESGTAGPGGSGVTPNRKPYVYLCSER